MKTVMNKRKLLEIVKSNREKHESAYLRAQVAYKEKGVKTLNNLIAKLENNETIYPFLNLPAPESHLDDYDRTIEMLEHDVRDEIELDENEFTRYVLDNWAWKESWLNSTVSYLDADEV